MRGRHDIVLDGGTEPALGSAGEVEKHGAEVDEIRFGGIDHGGAADASVYELGFGWVCGDEGDAFEGYGARRDEAFVKGVVAVVDLLECI